MQIRATSEYPPYSSINKSMHDDDNKQISATNGANDVEHGDSGAGKESSGGGDAAMDVDEEDDEVPAKENDGDVEMRDAGRIEDSNNDEISEENKPDDGATEMVVDDNGDDQDGGGNHAVPKDDSAAKKVDESETLPAVSEDMQSVGNPLKNEKERNDNTPGDGRAKTENKQNGTDPANGANDAPNPPPPVMKGTLSIDNRRHLIRGMWNYENSNAFAPQRFELVRTLASNEDETKLPLDGEFHGSFSLTYVTTNSKGKRKERSKVVPETGVKIKFTKKDSDEYEMEGRGTNQFGAFRIFGSAKPTAYPNDPTMNIMFRKLYEPGPSPADQDGLKKKSDAADAVDSGPLPEPSESFQRGVVCLRGKLVKDEMHETDVVHRISGLWAQGLDFIVSDPENTKGLCDRFEYEHKSAVPTSQFPVSGKYSGWFEILDEDGTRKKINERDVTLRFKKNNAGYHNVEGKGSNVFGRYTITGTFTAERMLTIFRHFQQRKIKAKPPQPAGQVAAAPVVPAASLAPPTAELGGPKLKLEDVDIPGDGAGKSFDAIEPPKLGTYSAVSRGVFRSNDDGSHSCQGKWASTREMFDTGQTLPMTFRLEPHHAAEAALTSPNNRFPLDSVMYKGSFNMKKGARAQAVVDQQVVMKFRKNKQGAYNVHGKGVNSIGEFNLIGSLILQGASAGQVELYRVYPPSKLAAAAVPPKTTSEGAADAAAPNALPRGPVQQGLARRGSSRTVKAPMWLEEDDPNAQISRTLDKCGQILKYLRDKDVEFGGFFGQPVDPIAMRIPTYFQVVKEPMDLKTIARQMEAGTVSTPAEFKRLVSLVFENAITFNIDPNHSVHKAARTLLGLFNQKFRDVERSIDSIRRTHGVEVDFEKGGTAKAGSKRGRADDPPKSLKRIRLDEAQRMAAANASAITAIVAAAPATVTSSVTRSEFNMLLNLIQQIQRQVVDTHKAVAELSPDGQGDRPRSTTAQASKRPSAAPQKKSAPAAKTEKAPKKAPVRRAPVPERAEPVAAVLDDTKPLSMDEQVLLMDTINELPQEHLGGVMQIIREAASVDAEEDEIDLEIDQLDVKTQRKLLRHVSKFVKKPKKTKKPKQQPIKKKADKTPEVTGTVPKKADKKDSQEKGAFFSFGGDSESDQEDDKVALPAAAPAASASDVFKLESLELADDDDDDDIGEESIAANWNFSKDAKAADKKESGDDDDDNDWGAAAREQAAAAKARDADRKAREEKKKADAEQASKERLADAAARGEEIKAQRAEEQAREASKREEKEREAELAREAAKAKAKAQLETVEQTVDLDEQRDIMKQYELSDTGGASPSSDFGF